MLKNEKYKIENIKNKVLCGDVISELKKIPDESIDTVITSPPYFGLRSYDSLYDKEFSNKEKAKRWILKKKKENKDYFSKIREIKDIKNKVVSYKVIIYSKFIKKNQVGLEETPKDYINRMVEIAKEVKRVLKKTGSFWLNIGDSYNTKSGSGMIYGNLPNQREDEYGVSEHRHTKRGGGKYPTKCLLQVPQRIAIALTDKVGFTLRNDIIWAKQVLIHKKNSTIGNVMPSSVRDRLNNSYEHLFFFVKSKEKSNDINEWLPHSLEKEDASWLAAMIDAEGTIGIRRSKLKNKHDTFGAFVVMTNSCKEIIERCLSITGIGNIRKMTAKTNFTMYLWEVSHQKSISVIGEIYPYLIQKREQAKVAIALQKTNLIFRKGAGQKKGRLPRSNKEYQEKIRLFELIKKLNQRKIKNSGLPEPNFNRIGSCEKYYFDLDSIRIPHQTVSLERYQRAVNLGAIQVQGKMFEDKVDKPMQPPKVFREKFGKDKNYKGKFSGSGKESENYGSPRARNERVSKVPLANTGLLNKEPYKENNPHRSRLKNSKNIVDLPQSSHQGKTNAENLASYRDFKIRKRTPRGGLVPGNTSQARSEHDVRNLKKEDSENNEVDNNIQGKNLCDVWQVNTQPSSIKHFALFPVALVSRPIKTCLPNNGIVLDPFFGGGTTAIAQRLYKPSASFIGIEINPEYIKIAEKRIREESPDGLGI